MIHLNLKKYRLKRGWSQTKLAAELRTNAQAVQRWERKEVEMRASTISRICKALDITPNDLFGVAGQVELGESKLDKLRRLSAQIDNILWGVE